MGVRTIKPSRALFKWLIITVLKEGKYPVLSTTKSLTKQGNVWKLDANNLKNKTKDVNQKQVKR